MPEATTYTLSRDVKVNSGPGKLPFLLRGETTIRGRKAAAVVALPDDTERSQATGRAKLERALGRLEAGEDA